VHVRKEEADWTHNFLLLKFAFPLSDLKAMEKICDAQDLELARLDASVKVPAVDLKEALSLAMSVSWQSAVDQGAKIESVKSELEYVINTYPNTAGAQQAQDILQAN